MTPVRTRKLSLTEASRYVLLFNLRHSYDSSRAFRNDGRLHDVRVTLGNTHCLLELFLTQPFARGREIPAEDSEDRHGAKDDAGKVERASRHGEEEWRDHDLDVISVVNTPNQEGRL